MTKKEKTELPKAILRERLYVPTDYVTPAMRDAWTYVVPDPESDDPNDKIKVQLYKEFNDGKIIGFCRGDLGKIRRIFKKSGIKIKDRRVCPPMTHPITMKTKLFSPETDSQGRNQQKVSSDWRKKGYGQIHSPARSGKTVMSTDIICRSGAKTLILTHQKDILDQFERTIREHTDVEDLEKMAGIPLVGRLDKHGWEKINELDIVLSSWQIWWHPSKRHFLKKHRDSFGMVLVDESHLSQAECYSYVVNSFNSKYRCGNTATPVKSNELHVIIENILGPVVAVGSSKQLSCSVEYIHTNFVVKSFPKGKWTTMISRLVKDVDRNNLIVNEAVEDVKKGRYVLITTERTKHAKKLAEMLNLKGVEAIHVVGSTAARDTVWEKARKGEVKVVVAMRRITRLGIDVPLWDTFYNIIPTSDPYNYYQEISRVRTYYPNKPTPIIKDFIDEPEESVKGAVLGTMRKRNAVYLEQGFQIKNAAFRKKKESKGLKWGKRARKD